MKLVLILNPAAGKNKGAKAIEKAIPLLQNRGIQFEIQASESPGHAIQLAQEFEPSKYDGIVAVGGDGTLFEVLNGLLSKTWIFILSKMPWKKLSQERLERSMSDFLNTRKVKIILSIYWALALLLMLLIGRENIKLWVP